MDTIFIEDGIEWISWTDEEGNEWTAQLDEVQWFGKECFEQMPTAEDMLGSYGVDFKNPDTNGLLPEPTEEDYEYADSFYEQDWESFLEWCRKEEIC